MNRFKQLLGMLGLVLCPFLLWAAPVQHHTFKTSDGVRLHYLEAGTGPQTIVFVPGWLMPAAVFEQQLIGLSNQYRVLALDPRSQGLSELTKLSHAPARQDKFFDFRKF